MLRVVKSQMPSKSIAATHMSVHPRSAFLGYEFARHKAVHCSECLSESCFDRHQIADQTQRKVGCICIAEIGL